MKFQPRSIEDPKIAHYLCEVKFPPLDVEVREMQICLLKLFRSFQRVRHLGYAF